MPKNQDTNPWGDAANQAVGALYKYYMSQPTAADQQRAQMENQLLQSRMETEDLNRQNIQSQMGERQFDLGRKKQQSSFADKFAEQFGTLPAVGTETPVSDGMYGPGVPITQNDRNNSIAGLFEQFAPVLPEDTVESVRDSLGTAGAMRFSDPIQRQLAIDEKATSYDNLMPGYTLSPGQIKFGADDKMIQSAPFKQGGGSYIQSPDGTVVSIDGGMPPLRPNVMSNLQEKDISFDTYRTFSDNLRNEITSNPQSVGTRGNLARLTDGILGQVDSIAPNSPMGDQLREIVNVTAGQYTDPITGQILNEDLYSAATIANLLPFVAAEAIVGQGGRSLSNEDRMLIEKAIGSPEDWLATPDRLVSRMDQLDNVVDQLRVKYQGRMLGERPLTPAPDNDPLSTAKVQRWGRDVNGNPVPIGGQ